MERQFFACLMIVGLSSETSLLADTLKGVVHDEQNKPIAGARIDIATAAPKVGRGIFCPSCYLDCKKWTRTNEAGEFEIKGLDPSLKFRVLTTAAGMQTRMTDLVDPSKDTVTLTLAPFPKDIPRERILEGTIVDKEGTPIPGALVEPGGAQTSVKRWWGRVEMQSVVSDDNGRFKMLLAPDYLGVDLRVTADGYAGVSKELLKPADGPHEIIVPAGTRVSGRLIQNGKPRSAQPIAVVQTDRGARNHFIKSVLAVTDHEGRFEFDSLPASQEYAIFSPVGGVDSVQEPTQTRMILATKKFQCRGDDESRDLGSLELQAGATLAGQLRMSDGSTLPSDLKLSLGRNPAWDLIEVPVDQDGHFSISGLPPETYEVMVNAKGIQFDESQLRFQLVRQNSFGIRLRESEEGIEVALRHSTAPAGSETPAGKERTADSPMPSEDSIVREAEATPEAEDPRSTQVTKRVAAEFTKEPTPENGPRLRVRGTVIDSQGKRIAGSTIILRAKIQGQFYASAISHNRDVLARTTTDANGRFTLSEVPIPPRMHEAIASLISGRGGAQVLAYAEGYGLTAANVESLDGDTLKIVLKPEADVQGTVIDEKGEPISMVQVKLQAVTNATGDINNFFNRPDEFSFVFSEVELTAITDPSGRFVLRNMPDRSRIFLSFMHPSHAVIRQLVETGTASDSLDPPKPAVTQNKETLRVMRCPIKMSLKQTATVSIRVRDADGAAIDQGFIEVVNPQQQYSYFRLPEHDGVLVVPFESSGEYRFTYGADPLTPSTGVSLRHTLNQDEGNSTMEIRLPKTRWIKGRVVNSVTDEPIPGIMVVATRTGQNENRTASTAVISSSDGDFQLPVVAGENRLAVIYHHHGFITEASFFNNRQRAGLDVDIPEEGEVSEVTLKLSPGLVLSGTVVNHQGEPVGNLVVRADQIERPFLNAAARTDAKGRFTLAGLSPNSETLVSAISGATAARVAIGPIAKAEYEEGAHQVVQLQLTPGVQLTGRVMRNGKPVSGVKMELQRSLPGRENMMMPFTIVTTNADGRYTVGGFDVGDRYEFKIEAQDGAAAPGWVHQSPYIQTIIAGPTDVRELPDANLISSNQTLKGIVVDPKGNPVEGISVSASLKNRGMIPRRENAAPPWTETDSKGRFQLSQLPDESIELMAYKRNPAGGQIHYPASFTTDRNQQDIRIVYDPTLAEGVEDLDKK